MPTSPKIQDYTNRDYESLLISLLDLAALKLPEWRDRSPNDLGRMMVELFAYTGDVLLYHQDRIANEAFLSTAAERRSVIDLLALLGYTLGTPAAASVQIDVTAPDDASVEIEVGARFATQTDPPIEFIYLPISSNSLAPSPPNLTIAAGETATISVFNAALIRNEIIGTSSGEANQRFRLSQAPVLLPRDVDAQTLLWVEVGLNNNFQRWLEQSTLLNSTSDDPHFIVRIDELDQGELIFGDGTFGQIPPINSTIRVSYLIGGGTVGNVAAGTITNARSGVIGGSVSIAHSQPASGGSDRETIDNARRQAPGVFRSQGRAVTAEDYVALAENIPGVAKAIALAPSWNYVDLHIVASNFDLTDELQARLLRYFESRRMVSTRVSVRSPIFVSIDVSARIGIEPTFYREDVLQACEAGLRLLFAIETLRFGQPFYLSKIFEILEAVPGTAFVDIPTFVGNRFTPGGATQVVDADNARILLTPVEFPRPGLITVEADATQQGLPISQGGFLS